MIVIANALINIKEIVENAILLDTEISKKDEEKNPYQSFVHKFYSIISIDSKFSLIKITIDELNSPETLRRAYNLKNIEISPEVVSQDFTPADASDDNGENISTISISDLFKIVKLLDNIE